MPKPQEASSAVVSTSIGKMRPAGYHEITAYLRDLEAQTTWKAVHDFAHQLFGERAHHVEIETGDEYDDEHYYRVIEDVVVYDIDNNPLPYDLTLPYWSQAKPDHSDNATSLLEDFEASLKEEEAKATEPLEKEDREQLLQEYTHEYVRDTNLYAEFDLPPEDATFALDEPPPEITGPVLYILVDQKARHQSVC
jgi:hypothetical protein